MIRIYRILIGAAVLAMVHQPSLIMAGCIEGVGPNGERMPCYPDSWRPGGSGGGGGAPPAHVPTPRDRSNTQINLGNSHWNQGDYKSAIEQYRQALAIDPSNPHALSNISKAYVNWGNRLYDSGDLDQAEWAYRQSIENGDAGATNAYNGLGNIADKRGDYTHAIELYEQALRIDPSNQAARDNLESVRRYLKRQSENRALEGLADDAMTALRNRDLNTSLAKLRELLRRDPGDEWVLRKLGLVLSLMGRNEEAISYYRQAIAAGADQAAMERNIEMARADIKKAEQHKAFEDANAKSGTARIAALKDLMARYPNQKGRIQVDIAEVQKKLGDLTGYRRTLETYLAGGDDGSRAYHRAKSKLDSLMVDKANKVVNTDDHRAQLDAMRSLRRLRGEHPNFDRVEAGALAKLGRRADGIALLRKSIDRFPEHAGLRDRLAWLLFQEGNAAEAVEHAKRAVELDPGNEFAQWVLERAEDYEGSVTQFIDEKLLGLKPNERVVDTVVNKAKAWWQSDDSPNTDQGPGLWASAKERVSGWFEPGRTPSPTPRQTADAAAPKSVPGAFGATAPPSPKLGGAVQRNPFQDQVQQAFASTPEPVVRLTKASIQTAKETWTRAGTEAKAAFKSTGLDWVASKLPKTQTLKSIVEKTAQFHGDYSAPIKAHFAYTMASASAAAATQAGQADLDVADYERGAGERAEAVQKMADDLARKSMEWGISGGILPDGSKAEEGIHIGDRLVGYVEKVLRLDQLWAFNREDEIEKWSAARASE